MAAAAGHGDDGEVDPAPEVAGGGSCAVTVALASTESTKISIWDSRAAKAERFLEHRAGCSLGQCMSLLFHGERLLLAGYEDGSVDAFDLVAGRWTDRPPDAAADSKMHSEPVLGLLPLPVPRDRTGKARRGRQGATANCLSCGADGRICTFDLPSAGAGPNFVPGPASKVIDAPPSETESRGLNQLAARQDGHTGAG